MFINSKKKPSTQLEFKKTSLALFPSSLIPPTQTKIHLRQTFQTLEKRSSTKSDISLKKQAFLSRNVSRYSSLSNPECQKRSRVVVTSCQGGKEESRLNVASTMYKINQKQVLTHTKQRKVPFCMDRRPSLGSLRSKVEE